MLIKICKCMCVGLPVRLPALGHNLYLLSTFALAFMHIFCLSLLLILHCHLYSYDFFSYFSVIYVHGSCLYLKYNRLKCEKKLKITKIIVRVVFEHFISLCFSFYFLIFNLLFLFYLFNFFNLIFIFLF